MFNTHDEEAPWDLGEASRRDFLKLMGFSLGAAALASCTPIPERQAVPPLALADGAPLPGVETWYATTCGGCGAGCGLLAKTRDGRPIKIEGNPSSPVSGGATCATGQAAVLSLYDDRRLRGPLLQGRPASWAEVDAYVAPRLAAISAQSAARGGLALLTGTIHSPSSRKLIAGFLARHPGSRHAVWEPVSFAATREANRRSFGRAVIPQYRFDRARRVVGIEADFLGTWLSPVEIAKAWARGRRPDAGGPLPRHYQIESGMSLTGGKADRRLAVLPSELGLAALALVRRVARRAGEGAPDAPDPALDPKTLDAVADDLWSHRGESLVVCGVNDLAVQTAVNRLNFLLGNVGRTVDPGRPSQQNQGDEAAVADLIAAVERGEVQGLLLWGVNPLYDHPEAGRLARALANVPLKVSFAERLDETAALADVVAPDHHFLESWGDAEPVEGCFGLRQPAIAPLFDTRAAEASLLRWMGEERPDAYRHLREHWQRELFPRQTRWASFDDFWDHSLQDGACELNPSTPEPAPAHDAGDLAAATAAIVAAHQEARSQKGYEVLLYEKVGLRDGRHANNPWLQELPDPVSRLTWGNQIDLSPRLAAELGLEEGDVVALRHGNLAPKASLELPVRLQPGQPQGMVAVALGYGRTRAGKVADGLGANAFPLAAVRDGFLRGWAAGARLEKMGRRETLAAVQRQSSMEGRPIVRTVTPAELRKGREGEEAQDSLWKVWPREGHHWGMAIDLDACIGCSACVVACQAENNVPVVGKDQVRRQRIMHWIRIDRYQRDDGQAIFHQPMMC
ncbi:MAG: molybdopterin-dependent oxidoreductase, partial [Thermoanaerobaculia bacterium]